LHKKKQTLKIIIFFTKPKSIAYKLRPKKNVPPTFSMEKEGGACKGFSRTTTKEGITITNLTKTNPPILSTRENVWGN
jgi:hypothetical protein